MATKLSPHFTFEELVRTSHKEFAKQNEEYGKKNINKLKNHAEFLETVRDLLGCPLLVSSSVRCPELNSAVGGASTSQHMRCEASDLIPVGMSVPDAFIKIYKSNLLFDQLILEQAGGKEWIHISFVPNINRKEALTYNGKKYVLYKG